jgi:transcriptional regulator with XRE-family HTH domain
MEPFIWRELTTEVDAGFVFASALRLERDPRVARGGEERRVLARHVAAASKRLSTRRTARVHALRDFAHCYTVGVGDGRDHVVWRRALGTPGYSQVALTASRAVRGMPARFGQSRRFGQEPDLAQHRELVDDVPVLGESVSLDAVDVDPRDRECCSGRGDAGELADVRASVCPTHHNPVALRDDVLDGEMRRKRTDDDGEPIDGAITPSSLPGDRVVLEVALGDQLANMLDLAGVQQFIETQCGLLRHGLLPFSGAVIPACRRPHVETMKCRPPTSAPNYCADMGHLAGVLRSFREDAAMTQEELADKAGLSVRTVSDIERGLRKRLYHDTAERLATALGLAGAAHPEFVELARGRAPDMRRDLDAEFRRRFVAWHVDRVSALADSVGHEDQWYAVLDADEPNLTVALRWAADAGDTESLLQLSAGLFRYWQARGHLAIGRQWLERGLNATPAASASTRMTALWGLAWLAYQQGDDASAAKCARELGDLADDSDDAGARRNAATVSGIVALARNDVTDAVRDLGEALLLAREIDQPWLLATSLLNLGIAKIAAGETADARMLIGEALREYARLGDERFRARSLGYLGLASLVDDDPERGEALYAQSLTVFETFGEAKGIAEALTGLATAAARRGLPARAAQLGGAAERIRESFAGRALPVERRLAEAHLAAAKVEAGDGPWNDAWTGGRALRDDEVIDVALTLPAP